MFDFSEGFLSNITFSSIIAGAFLFWLLTGIRFVSHKTYRVVEVFGKYKTIWQPGLNITWPTPISSISSPVETNILKTDLTIKLKTNDNQFIQFPVAMHFKVIPGMEKEAFYELESPVEQMRDFLANQVRSKASSKNVESLFSDKSDMSNKIVNELNKEFKEYGFVVTNVIVEEPELSAEVEHSYNAVVAAKRDKEAAELEREATKSRMIGVAEGEAESLALKGEGHRRMREKMAEGVSTAMKNFRDTGISDDVAIKMMMTIDKNDMLRDSAKSGAVIIASANNESKGDGFSMESMIGALKAVGNDNNKT